jgi:hypothetical protein
VVKGLFQVYDGSNGRRAGGPRTLGSGRYRGASSLSFAMAVMLLTAGWGYCWRAGVEGQRLMFNMLRFASAVQGKTEATCIV